MQVLKLCIAITDSMFSPYLNGNEFFQSEETISQNQLECIVQGFNREEGQYLYSGNTHPLSNLAF